LLLRVRPYFFSNETITENVKRFPLKTDKICQNFGKIMNFVKNSVLKSLKKTKSSVLYYLNWKSDQIYNASSKQAAFIKGIHVFSYVI
jgi:hypothetical protein